MAKRRTRRRQRGGRDLETIKSDIEQKETDIEMATKSLNQLRNELKEEQDRKTAEAAAASDTAQSRWKKIKTRGFAQIGVDKAKKRLEELKKCSGPGKCNNPSAQSARNICLSYEYNLNAENQSKINKNGMEEIALFLKSELNKIST